MLVAMTAPVNAIYALHEALLLLREEGLEPAWKRHARNHRALAAGLEALGLSLPVAPAHRLPQLNAVSVPTGVDEAAVRGRLLRVGPYQGTLGCLEIQFGKGVCGVSAAKGETVVVEDVHAFPGHIACDPSSRSEIVVPIATRDGELCAVLDLDSHQPAAFDETDRRGLEAVARLLSRHLRDRVS